MSSALPEPTDLLDLKLVPAWVKETAQGRDYSDYAGEEPELPREQGRGRHFGRGRDGRERRPQAGPRGRAKEQPGRAAFRKKKENRGNDRKPDRFRTEQPAPAPEKPVQITVRFLPRPPVLENVVAQIQSEALAYSLFFLARLFLERPQRYDVYLKSNPETPLYRLGEEGQVSLKNALLEENAFRLAKEQFYRIDITQSEPLKGNFSSVARCRLSGTLLGPTNHHAYQPRLRNLYEQRFSRRLDFAEYQRQIEILTDPEVVERWKEEARTITTFTPLRDEPAVALPTAAEAERHFRQNYLAGLVQKIEETTIDGLTSRQLTDRAPASAHRASLVGGNTFPFQHDAGAVEEIPGSRALYLSSSPRNVICLFHSGAAAQFTVRPASRPR